ncbi:MAG: aminopeptidase [Clostridia bacterium]|nr:aminopeptidase [Clostridia bacterium]
MSEDKKVSEAKKLKESLLAKPVKPVAFTKEVYAAADEYAEGYKAFLGAVKTEREAVKWAEALAQQNGFVPLEPGKALKAGDKVYKINRCKAIILATIGKRPIGEGVSFAIAHIDSPRLDLKPNPLYEKGGLCYFDTHYYGGIKKYQWPTVPLALYGVVVRKDGSVVEVRIGDDEGDPVFVVTDLLIHLGKDQMRKTASEVIDGENLDILIGSRPFDDSQESDLIKLNIMRILHEKYGITEEDFKSAELEAVPAGKARDLGFDRSMIGAYGHDDRVCAYPALTALMALNAPEYTAVTVLTDKEEIGSTGASGMQAAYLENFIADLAATEGVPGYRVLSRSLCLSADVNAAYDPLYAEAFELRNSSLLGNGVVLTKYTGSRGKYDTSDASAELMGRFRRMMDGEDIAWQIGELGKVDGGGGGTIAQYMANRDVDTVDLGVPVLSMHAPFEVISKTDVYMAHRAFLALLSRKD